MSLKVTLFTGFILAATNVSGSGEGSLSVPTASAVPRMGSLQFPRDRPNDSDKPVLAVRDTETREGPIESDVGHIRVMSK